MAGTLWENERVWDGQKSRDENFRYSVRVWDTDSGEPVSELPFDGHPTAVVFSVDGRHLLVGGSYEEALTVWDTATWEKVAQHGEPDMVYGEMAIAPNGQHVAVRSGSRVKIINFMSGEVVLDVSAGEGMNGIVFTPDGTKVAAASHYDGRIDVFDTSTGERVRSIYAASMFLTISPDGYYFTFADRGLLRFAIASVSYATDSAAQAARPKPGLDMPIVTLFEDADFSPDGRLLALVPGWGPWVLLWDVREGRQVAELRGPDAMVLTVAFSPDGKRLFATGFKDGAIRMWDLTGLADE